MYLLFLDLLSSLLRDNFLIMRKESDYLKYPPSVRVHIPHAYQFFLSPYPPALALGFDLDEAETDSFIGQNYYCFELLNSLNSVLKQNYYCFGESSFKGKTQA